MDQSNFFTVVPRSSLLPPIVLVVAVRMDVATKAKT
jgi:hypothetical protein